MLVFLSLCVLQDSEAKMHVLLLCVFQDCEAEIRAMLPDGNFSLMVTVLKKFLRFMDLTASV